MNTVGAEMIRKFKIRMIIGKGGMSGDVLQAMKETGCVYLAAIGGAAVSLADDIAGVAGVQWEDLGMAEAVWSLDVNGFGPLVVAMDAHGNSIYDEVEKKVKENVNKFYC
jgi:fumarate hydratase subunit beta